MKNKKARKSLGTPPAQSFESIKRLKNRWIMTAIGIGLSAVIVFIFSIMMQMPPALAKSDLRYLANYEQVSNALAADDLAAAKTATKSMEMESYPIGSAVARLEASTNLNSARIEFKVLSDHAVILARNQPGFFTMQCVEPCPMHCSHCPMDQFGPWVQSNPEVSNPYMGSAGSGCGRISDL